MIKKTDVPLGLVMMCAGGACIRELLPEEVAHEIGYNFGANVRESGYYNTLIHPFLKLPFKGMMFFQGESEGGDPNLANRYDLELALLVADERKRFGREFPFYNVQISSYREEGKQFFPWLDVIRVKQVTQFNPTKVDGVCDACGGELILRDDDKPETVKKRLEVYHKQTKPLIDYYTKAGKIVEIDGTLEMAEVFDAIIEILG